MYSLGFLQRFICKCRIAADVGWWWKTYYCF